MHTVGFLLLMTAVMMTQADQISDSLQLTPLKEHLHLFDVISDAPLADVKGAVASFNPRHSFKICTRHITTGIGQCWGVAAIGQDKYMFVIISSDTAALRDLTFPAGSVVTQHPVVHTSEFMAMFGVKSAWNENDTDEVLPDTVLMVHEQTFLQPETQCLTRYEREMASWARQFIDTHALVKPVSYAALAAYPPRIFIFDKFEENASQNVARMGMEQVGGPGRNLLTTTRIVKI
ncbi:uncharacterized protein LOC143295260 [Babylonia areolata]|uniref:uncharacterized protein LOC143295260 n=1 Tax=Babylonia areolata TaxID=304850 RepID=UPI003FCF02F5